MDSGGTAGEVDVVLDQLGKAMKSAEYIEALCREYKQLLVQPQTERGVRTFDLRVTCDELRFATGMTNYRVLRTLGEGTYGVALQVQIAPPSNTSFGSDIYVLKLIKKRGEAVSDQTEVLDRLEKLFKLQHPNVVQYFSAGIPVNQGNEKYEYAILQEYVDGPNLETVITTSKTSKQETLSFILQLLAGLVYIHSEKIMHADLRGANILLTADRSTLKIGDLDDCLYLQGNVTVSSDVPRQCGAFAYMSPEMVVFSKEKGGKRIGRSTDVWSFGCVLLDMLCGGRFYMDKEGYDNRNEESAPHQYQVFFLVGNGKKPYIPTDIDPEIAALLRTCFEFDPAKRPKAVDILVQWRRLADLRKFWPLTTDQPVIIGHMTSPSRSSTLAPPRPPQPPRAIEVAQPSKWPSPSKRPV